jgi:transcriptional regulator with XRE-family HTH domain
VSEPDPLLIALGNAIRGKREERGLTRAKLAATTGVHERRVTALEEGRLDPDYELLLLVADALGTRASALIIHAEELGRRGD